VLIFDYKFASLNRKNNFYQKVFRFMHFIFRIYQCHNIW